MKKILSVFMALLGALCFICFAFNLVRSIADLDVFLVGMFLLLCAVSACIFVWGVQDFRKEV